LTLFDFGDKHAPQRNDEEPEEELGPAEATYCLGGLLLSLGVGSLVLNWLGMEFFILAWVDFWGETIGTIIRFVAIAVGAALLALGKKPNSNK
jgi:hypothetical protein